MTTDIFLYFLVDLACEWNLTALQKALIPAAILTGAAIGSFVGGKVADSFGRKSILIASYYLITIASIISITATNYYVYIVARAFCGKLTFYELNIIKFT